MSSYEIMPDELAPVAAHTADPDLRALEVAIFLEEAVDIVLPDELLDADHLGSSQAALATLESLLGEA